MRPIRRILAATGFAPCAQEALDLAVELAAYAEQTPRLVLVARQAGEA